MKRLLLILPVLALALLGILFLGRRTASPADLAFTPVDDDARALVERMLKANQPWLNPKPFWARYSFQRRSRSYSPADAFRQRSIRLLYRSEAAKDGPFTARWRSEEDLRLGVELRTPLHAMLQPGARYSIHKVGASEFQARKVVGVDVLFEEDAPCAIGLGAGYTHYCQSSYGFQIARVLIEPGRAIPLFIGTSRSRSFGAQPRFESTWTLGHDFFALDGGWAPRVVQWQMQDCWKERLDFQVTTNGAWIFRKGWAGGGMSKQDRWSGFSQRFQMTDLKTEELRPGDLLQQYPPEVGQTNAGPVRYEEWEMTRQDVFHLSQFQLQVGRGLQLNFGETELGIAHGPGGAYWAVLIPRKSGTLTTHSNGPPEEISHALLRFHPRQIGRLFPRETVTAADAALLPRMRVIGNLKTIFSWPAGAKITMPGPEILLVDADTSQGARRFLEANISAEAARLVPELEPLPVERLSETTPGLTEPLSEHEQEVNDEARDSTRPHVTAVFPPEDAVGIPPATELRVRFDRPMDPTALKLDWECGGFTAAEFPRYDPERFEFTIPVRLAPGALHQVLVNKPLFFGFGEKISDIRKRGSPEGFASAERRLGCLHVWRFLTAWTTNSTRASPPRVVRVTPPPGSRLPLLAFVEVQFDQAMAGPEDSLPYVLSEPAQMRTPHVLPRIEYDPVKFAFRIPLLMPARPSVKFSMAGFRSAQGVSAAPVELEFAASGLPHQGSDQQSVSMASTNPALLDLLGLMKQKRAELASVAERVEELSMEQCNGFFTRLRCTGSAFKWQQTGECYGDVSHVMGCALFRIGADGRECWSQYQAFGEDVNNLESYPVKEVGEWDLSFCDPFELTRKTPAEAAAALGLGYAGLISTPNGPRHLLETSEATWQSGLSMTLGSLSQWSIDPQTCLPRELVDWRNESLSRKRFLYDAINQPLPKGDFAVPQVKGASRETDVLNADYTNRFVKIHDGSAGAMSLRLGKYGPKGSASGGLN